MSAAILSSSAPSSAASFTRAAGTLVRALAALGIAAAVTFALFSVMQALIATDEAPPAPVPAQPDITIRFQPPEIETVRPSREFTVEPVAPPPERRRLVVDVQPRPVEGGYQTEAPPIDNSVVMAGVDAIPMPPPPLNVRVEPSYPRTELNRGVQGDCTVRYDILASGRTANAQVMGCDSRGFERASLQAVAQWRHAAATGGDPNAVVQRGVTTTLAFRLED